VKEPKDLIRKFLEGGLSRREFVERGRKWGTRADCDRHRPKKASVFKTPAKRLRNPDQTTLILMKNG